MAKIVRGYLPGGQVVDIPEMLTYDELTARIGGFIEVYTINKLSVVADEEGRLKNLPVCCTIGPYHLRGPVYIGKLTDDGLEPVDAEFLQVIEGWVKLV